MSATFDADLRPVDCPACGQRVVHVEGRCPLCAALAARGRGAQRPLVAPPWPRLVVTRGAPLATPRGPRAELSLAAVVVLGRPGAGLGDGQPPALRVEPLARAGGGEGRAEGRPARPSGRSGGVEGREPEGRGLGAPRHDEGEVLCTALADGVTVDGAALAPGASRPCARGAALAFGGREARIL